MGEEIKDLEMLKAMVEEMEEQEVQKELEEMEKILDPTGRLWKKEEIVMIKKDGVRGKFCEVGQDGSDLQVICVDCFLPEDWELVVEENVIMDESVKDGYICDRCRRKL